MVYKIRFAEECFTMTAAVLAALPESTTTLMEIFGQTIV